MASVARSSIPIRLRVDDFSHRLDVEWSQMVNSMSFLPVKWRNSLIPTEKRITNPWSSISDHDNSLFRRAPLHPWLRVNPRPQRHVLWGSFVFSKNILNALALATASFVCFVAREEFQKSLFRPFGYFLFVIAINPFILSRSVINSTYAIFDTLASVSLYFFDPYRGVWTKKDTYTNVELTALRSEIFSMGRLYFLLRQNLSNKSNSNLVGFAHYESLGLQRNATSAEIHEVYLRLKKMHTFTGETRRLEEINSAYVVLGHPEKRSLYDEGGEGAVCTRGSNPLFLGFCNPYSSAHRVDLRDFIGGPLITTWFTGDPYFGHIQLRNLDRILISATELEILFFIRAGSVCDSLYHRVLKHSLDVSEERFSKAASVFVQKYVVTSPLGMYIAFMLGEIYIACANDLLKKRSVGSEAKSLLYQRMAKFIPRLWKQLEAYRAGNQHMMGYNTLSAQLDALEIDIWFLTRLAVHRLFIQITDAKYHSHLARALRELGVAMQRHGKKWDDSGGINVSELHKEMDAQANRWRSVDVNGVSFV